VDDLNLPFVSILGNKRKGMNSMSFIFDKMRKFYTNNEQIVQLNTNKLVAMLQIQTNQSRQTK
jgi:hypothetical protein